MNNFDKAKLINAIISSSNGKLDREKLTEAADKKDVSSLIGGLSEDDKKKLMAALNDKNALNELLKSPQAKALLNSFLKGGGKNG